jgi:hypothetical protein
LIDWCLMPPLAIFHLYYGIHVCPHYMNDKDDKKLWKKGLNSDGQ